MSQTPHHRPDDRNLRVPSAAGHAVRTGHAAASHPCRTPPAKGGYPAAADVSHEPGFQPAVSRSTDTTRVFYQIQRLSTGRVRNFFEFTRPARCRFAITITSSAPVCAGHQSRTAGNGRRSPARKWVGHRGSLLAAAAMSQSSVQMASTHPKENVWHVK